jgi:ribosomal protein S18 acetylase RimI-like enzyme
VFYHNGVFTGSFGVLDKAYRSQVHLEIYDVIINESYRNKGLGQQMLRELINMFGHESLQLGVEVSNIPACHVYKKLGFKIIRNLNVPGLGPCYWMQRLPQDNSK